MNISLSIETAVKEAPNLQASDTQAAASEQGGSFDLMLCRLMQAVMALPVQTILSDTDPAVQAEDNMAGTLPTDDAAGEMASMSLETTLQISQSAFVTTIANLLNVVAAQEDALPDSSIRQIQTALLKALSSLHSDQADAAADTVKKAPAIEAQQPQIMREIILAEGSSKDMADLPEADKRMEKILLPETLSANSVGSQGIIRIHTVAGEGPAALVRPQQFSEAMHMEGNRFVITRLDGTSIEISLQPEGLGKLDISLVTDKGVVNAQIQASSAAGKELLEKHMSDIVNALAQEGLSIGGFSVSLKDDSSDFSWSQGQSQEHQIQGEPVMTGEYISPPRQLINRGMVSIFV